MCGNMANIQSAMPKIRRGKKRRQKKEERRKKKKKKPCRGKI